MNASSCYQLCPTMDFVKSSEFLWYQRVQHHGGDKLCDSRDSHGTWKCLLAFFSITSFQSRVTVRTNFFPILLIFSRNPIWPLQVCKEWSLTRWKLLQISGSHSYGLECTPFCSRRCGNFESFPKILFFVLRL